MLVASSTAATTAPGTGAGGGAAAAAGAGASTDEGGCSGEEDAVWEEVELDGSPEGSTIIFGRTPTRSFPTYALGFEVASLFLGGACWSSTSKQETDVAFMVVMMLFHNNFSHEFEIPTINPGSKDSLKFKQSIERSN